MKVRICWENKDIISRGEDWIELKLHGHRNPNFPAFVMVIPEGTTSEPKTGRYINVSRMGNLKFGTDHCKD